MICFLINKSQQWSIRPVNTCVIGWISEYTVIVALSSMQALDIYLPPNMILMPLAPMSAFKTVQWHLLLSVLKCNAVNGCCGKLALMCWLVFDKGILELGFCLFCTSFISGPLDSLSLDRITVPSLSYFPVRVCVLPLSQYTTDISLTCWYIKPMITRLIDWMVDWLIDRLIDWSIDRLIDWSIDRLIDWVIDWLIGWLIDWLIDWLKSLLWFVFVYIGSSTTL